MKIEKVSIKQFRCFGPRGAKIKLESGVTAFVGGNGSGKTAVFQALSRLFGITPAQRTVRRRDFHLPADQQELQPGANLSIEAVLSFPELNGLDEDDAEDAVPEFFLQMAASAPGAPLKARMRLQATWTDDGTPDGSIDEDLRWITTLDDDFEWDDCKRVQAVERGSVHHLRPGCPRRSGAGDRLAQGPPVASREMVRWVRRPQRGKRPGDSTAVRARGTCAICHRAAFETVEAGPCSGYGHHAGPSVPAEGEELANVREGVCGRVRRWRGPGFE